MNAGGDARRGALRASILATAAVAAILALGWAGLPGEWVSTAAAVAMLAIPWWLLRDDPSPWFTFRPGKDLLPVLVWSLVVFPPFVLGFHVWHCVLFEREPNDLMRVLRVLGDLDEWLPEMLLTQVVAIAIPEEVLFRGYIQRRLTPHLGALRVHARLPELPWAVVAASLLFASIHLVAPPHPARLAVFFPGLLFGWLYHRTGSLTAPALFHALCNIVQSVCWALWFG